MYSVTGMVQVGKVATVKKGPQLTKCFVATPSTRLVLTVDFKREEKWANDDQLQYQGGSPISLTKVVGGAIEAM